MPVFSAVSVSPGAERNTPHRQEPVLLLCETRNLWLIATTPLTSIAIFGPTTPVVMSWIVTVCAAPPVPLLLEVLPLLLEVLPLLLEVLPLLLEAVPLLELVLPDDELLDDALP